MLLYYYLLKMADFTVLAWCHTLCITSIALLLDTRQLCTLHMFTIVIVAISFYIELIATIPTLGNFVIPSIPCQLTIT